MEDSLTLKRLVEEAYHFGYFVGYRGHSEWAEWVRGKRVQLYSLAEEMGILEIVQEAYRRGRAEGARKREEDIRKSLDRESPAIEGQRTTKVPTVKSAREAALRGAEGELIEFLETTRLCLPPDLLDTLKNLRPPRMLRQGL